MWHMWETMVQLVFASHFVSVISFSSHPMTHLATRIPTCPFSLLLVKRRRETWQEPPPLEEVWQAAVRRGPAWKQSPALLEQRLGLPTPNRPVSFYSCGCHGFPDPRLRNPICLSVPSTESNSSFLLTGVCKIFLILSASTFSWIRNQLKAKQKKTKQKLYYFLFSWDSSYNYHVPVFAFNTYPKAWDTGNDLLPQMCRQRKGPI